MDLNGTFSGASKVATSFSWPEMKLKNEPESCIEGFVFKNAGSLLNFDKMPTVGYMGRKKSLHKQTYLLVRFLLNAFSDALIKKYFTQKRLWLENTRDSG